VFQRNVRYARSGLIKVVRGIQMGAGVDAHGDVGDIAGVSLPELHVPIETKLLIPWPYGYSLSDSLRYIVDFHS